MELKTAGIVAAVLMTASSAFAESAMAPEKVITFVQKAPAPTTRVVVKEKIVVGQALPETVVVTPIPDETGFAYAIVNDERVIVEPSTRKVIQVVQ
ncbi:DUF1236 domain-containing protein [Rhizobium sp. 16-449-1b]|uniref:DUF1236 domain-containing protein n=1 Tax=Rhizobium sp. 16-449-1b TaxID=2819989 RepID=UPI001ADCCB70|nr:DUF1236 domain-containing protein [Rhizobium sp. 16-449-1b]MBO9198325.1 DUF1236 domain-containing protein [Rhizobium sp. 16-449-1b]